MRNMFLILAALSALYFPARSNASANEVIEGQTIKEKEIRWAWKYLGSIVHSCAASEDCQDPKVKAVVKELQTYLSDVPELSNGPWGKRLQFASEKENPKQFESGDCEIHRLAVTQKSKTAILLVNTDTMDLKLAEWIGILTHESVHHLGYDDEQSRLPDLVGAAVASHFQKNYFTTNLAEFNHPEIQFGFFNFPSAQRASLAWGAIAGSWIDLNFGPTTINPLCEAGEVFRGQVISSPIWRTSRIQSKEGIASVRASGFVDSRCQSSNGPIRIASASLHIRFDLQFEGPIDLTTSWWRQASKVDGATVIADTDDSQAELININRTFQIQSIHYNQLALSPSQAWQAQVLVQSLDSFVPSTCELYLTGSQWSFHQYMNLPAVARFESCQMTPKGPGLWLLEGIFHFPANAQSDLFYIPLIRFPSSTEGDRFAVPLRPSVVQFKNPSAAVPLKIGGWRVIGAAPADKMMGAPVVHSYKVEANRPFWVELDVLGSQNVGMEFMELDLYPETPGGIVIQPFSSRIDHMQPFILRSERQSIPGGIRLRYQMVLPSATPLPYSGFRIRRFYVATDDFSWVEWTMRNVLEANFITDKMAN